MAVEVPLGVLNVIDFGADPTGVKDSLPAILRAIAWRNVNINTDKGIIFFPPGTYTISGPIDFLPPKDVGSGIGAQLNGGQGSINFLGCGSASKIVGNFNDYVFKHLNTTYINYGGIGDITIEHLAIYNNVVSYTAGAIVIAAHVTTLVNSCEIVVGGNGIILSNNNDLITPTVGLFVFEAVVQNCTIKGAGKVSAGGTSISNGIGTCQSFSSKNNYISGFAYGYRTIGGGCMITGGRVTQCATGILTVQNLRGDTPSLGGQPGTLFAGVKFDNNDTTINGVVGGGASVIMEGLDITSNDGFGVDGITLSSGGFTNATFSGITVTGAFSGYAFSTPTGNNGVSFKRTFIGCTATNTSSSSRNWQVPTLAYGQCSFINCNNPDTLYPFSSLPDGSTFKPRAIGDVYLLSDCNIAPSGNFAATAAGGGANFAKVQWDGSNWVIC